jgi:phosphohistidine phosphatase
MGSRLAVYLIRHGIAADLSPDGSDEERPLTATGIDELRGETVGLDRLKVRLGLILTSPLVRARQTAEVLAAHLPGEPAVLLAPSLAPAGDPADAIVELRKHKDLDAIGLVGHEPGIGELAARLLGARVPVAFKKGGVCRIDLEGPAREGGGTLRWLATPKMLLLMGRARRH